jgi:hypothetical protein
VTGRPREEDTRKRFWGVRGDTYGTNWYIVESPVAYGKARTPVQTLASMRAPTVMPTSTPAPIPVSMPIQMRPPMEIPMRMRMRMRMAEFLIDHHLPLGRIRV